MTSTAARPAARPVPRLAALSRLPHVRGWSLAVVVYLLAVFHRSSLGVAGLIAEQRFGITAAELSTFVLLQIGVYAAMQVPTGVLVDRYGPRRMLVAAATLMGLGQLAFAVAPGFGTALFARALLGCGDAMTFVSVLRYASLRFSPRRYPVLVALTSTVGTVGNLAATLPLSLLLAGVGWTGTFAAVAVATLAGAALVALLLDDRTVAPALPRRPTELRSGVAAVARRVSVAWSLAGTRVGFWVHFSAMSTATVMSLLWGHPYLVDGAGFSPEAASTILMTGVLFSGAAGPVIGTFIGRRPNLRVAMVLLVGALTVLGWAVVLTCFGDHPPRVLVAALFVFTMLGGPTSMTAFALARDYNPARILGTASGVVNVGGFAATAVGTLGFGALVSALGGAGPHALRCAVAVPLAIQVFGAWRIVVWLRRLRGQLAQAQHAGESVPVPVRRHFPWDERWDVDRLVDQHVDRLVDRYVDDARIGVARESAAI